jgi:hypothetical protein
VNKTNIFTGLNDVQVGDFIIWDETIKTNPDEYSGTTPIDVGYPRHMAYVEKVTRSVSDPTIVQNILVSEMNWGKDLDSCGDTDMWGRQSERVIWNPSGTTSGITGTIYYPELKTFAPKPTGDKDVNESYASCENADWAVCVEKHWSQVKIYRPYNVDVEQDGSHLVTNINIASDPTFPVCTTGFPKKLDDARIKEIATNLGITLADMQAYDANAKMDTVSIRNYVNTMMAQGKYNPLTVINDGDNNPDNDIWKLLATPGTYPYDEVEKFLNNPLTGALDRCDPPVLYPGTSEPFRNNFPKVRDDAIKKAGAHTYQ